MPRICADFGNMIDARKTVEKLRNMGFKDACLDVVDRFTDEFAGEINIAGSENGVSLSALVMKSAGHLFNVSKAPMLAADPMASGLGVYEEIGDFNTRLRVSVDDTKIDDVKKLLIESGARV